MFRSNFAEWYNTLPNHIFISSPHFCCSEIFTKQKYFGFGQFLVQFIHLYVHRLIDLASKSVGWWESPVYTTHEFLRDTHQSLCWAYEVPIVWSFAIFTMILVPTVRLRIPQCGTPYKIQTQPDKTLLNQKHFRTPSSSSDDVVGARRAQYMRAALLLIASTSNALASTRLTPWLAMTDVWINTIQQRRCVFILWTPTRI